MYPISSSICTVASTILIRNLDAIIIMNIVVTKKIILLFMFIFPSNVKRCNAFPFLSAAIMKKFHDL